MITDRRLGRFRVAPVLLRLDEPAVRLLFSRVIVLEARYRFECNAVEYIAISEDFAYVPDFEIVPEYHVTCGSEPPRVEFRRC